ncbi:MAG: hypothetical protein A3G33_10615 [Omnitrophica bacterium RIFCSPLOWO2_12_FULL_44_17]|uniref:Small basic protein n=1 Tax=Candidatus Danuiimicrobium aquiferis TaxID=1801832 RepID=A0A1G1KR70_9BACT|nr:MAG: hypothetical protein A3B72_02935 [Omnitrophica bacterium RIFCSPHIGHO2_02_FULL_45_28]OGW89507.1 MAG: hypothetical protein A3E74_06975 [Omnitrophica bacterium RIFCSPHIGHO2_12_FULL_44_12]OGW95421.1 MAG: hypothetical protein A3G33_10615 [Omnitrophica bacterium RIFCSPLOWO2_12_FULL_44_17]OGX03303.1 MAG: hypothetical protein A3J12_07250 [Omnitrophica bacterium RIFCSPLOWO2_02_FULL_44_11]
MSQHSSLKNAEGSRKHRNVLKRYERIRKMQETDKWNDRGSIYKLPKIKMIKLKVKKVKEKPEEAAVPGAEGQAAAPVAAKQAAKAPAAKSAAAK